MYFDLTMLPHGDILIHIIPERVDILTWEIHSILVPHRRFIGPAGAFVGVLGFRCGQRFGRLGRSKLRPLSRRQYEHFSIGTLNIRMESALKLPIEKCSY